MLLCSTLYEPLQSRKWLLLEFVTKHRQIKVFENTPVHCCLFPLCIQVGDLSVNVFIVPDVSYETESLLNSF